MEISVVTTLYKSAPYIPEFVERTRTELKKLTDDYELILVDDGSPDNSLQTALEWSRIEPRLKIIELSRNFGHHKAMMTGLEHASGNLVFLIDVDLEEPPELLSTLFASLQEEDLDVVFGFQKARKGGLIERTSGHLAWRFLDLCLPVTIPHNHSTVRLMTRDYVQALVQHKEHKTAIGGLWVMTGFKQKGIEFEKGSRSGTSYSFSRRLVLLLDSITSCPEAAKPRANWSMTALMSLSSKFFGSVVEAGRLGKAVFRPRSSKRMKLREGFEVSCVRGL